MKSTKMIDFAIAAFILLLTIFPVTILAESNAVKVSGDLTLTKDINGNHS